jgi:hypothetical protein
LKCSKCSLVNQRQVREPELFLASPETVHGVAVPPAWEPMVIALIGVGKTSVSYEAKQVEKMTYIDVERLRLPRIPVLTTTP